MDDLFHVRRRLHRMVEAARTSFDEATRPDGGSSPDEGVPLRIRFELATRLEAVLLRFGAGDRTRPRLPRRLIWPDESARVLLFPPGGRRRRLHSVG